MISDFGSSHFKSASLAEIPMDVDSHGTRTYGTWDQGLQLPLIVLTIHVKVRRNAIEPTDKLLQPTFQSSKASISGPLAVSLAKLLPGSLKAGWAS